MPARYFLGLILCLPLAASAQSASLKSPNVSGNALMLYRNSNFDKENTSETRNGIDIQEAELAFYSDVDPYSRLTMIFTAAPQYTLNHTTNHVDQTWIFEPEELYAESDYVPGLTLRAGKFKAAFGKNNPVHTHALPFVEQPLVSKTLLGEEGLNDVGLSAAALLPVSWFSELTVQYLRGEGENDEFDSPTPGDGVGVGHFKNLLDVTDSLTMEAGASYARGGNATGGNTSLAGGDLTLKWRPTSGGLYRSAIFSVEYIDRWMQQRGSDTDRGNGWNAWGKYQFAERWAGLARYQTLRTAGDALTEGYAAEIQFSATEFSSFRVEYDYNHGPIQPNLEHNEQKILVQANFTIGAHPAHAY